MKRVCFYWFCMELKRGVKRNGQETNIVTFINEVIHPILCFGKDIRLYEYSDVTNPTRDIKHKEIRSDYRDIIDISSEDSRDKEIERLSIAFSKLNELNNWGIKLNKITATIKTVVKDKFNDFKLYLDGSEIERLNVHLSSRVEDDYTFYSFLLILLIHKIPNFEYIDEDHHENNKESCILDFFGDTSIRMYSDKESLIHFIFSCLATELILVVPTYVLTHEERKSTILSSKRKNCEILFYRRDYTLDYNVALLCITGIIPVVLLSDSICDTQLIQSKFIVTDGKLFRSWDKTISEKFTKGRGLASLTIDRYETTQEWFEKGYFPTLGDDHFRVVECSELEEKNIVQNFDRGYRVRNSNRSRFHMNPNLEKGVIIWTLEIMK